MPPSPDSSTYMAPSDVDSRSGIAPQRVKAGIRASGGRLKGDPSASVEAWRKAVRMRGRQAPAIEQTDAAVSNCPGSRASAACATALNSKRAARLEWRFMCRGLSLITFSSTEPSNHSSSEPSNRPRLLPTHRGVRPFILRSPSAELSRAGAKRGIRAWFRQDAR